jgi:hypothetical protein
MSTLGPLFSQQRLKKRTSIGSISERLARPEEDPICPPRRIVVEIALDFNPRVYNPIPARLAEGRLPETFGGWSRLYGPIAGKPDIGGAAPAAAARDRSTGRPRPPVRRHFRPAAFNGCTCVGTKASGSPPDKGSLDGRPLHPARKLRHRGQKSPQVERRGASASCAKTRPRSAKRGPSGGASRRSIPSHLAGGDSPAPPGRGAKGRQAYPAPRQRIRVIACGCLKVESDRRARGQQTQCHARA